MFYQRRKTGESSGDEDIGLEISMTLKTKSKERRKEKEKLLKEQLRKYAEKRTKGRGGGYIRTKVWLA